MRTDYTTLEQMNEGLVNAMKELKGIGPLDARDYWLNVYINMFNDCPHRIVISCDGIYNNEKANSLQTKHADYRKQLYTIHELNKAHTYFNLKKQFGHNSIFIRANTHPVIINNKFLIYEDSYSGEMCILSQVDHISDDIWNCIVDSKKDSSTFYYVSKTSYGFTTTEMEIKRSHINLDELYNDDLPHEKIMNFLSNDEAGLIMLHGEPGGGKTSYIRHLIGSFPSNKFLVMDNTSLNYMADASFINFLMDYQNHIIVLEDCESMLTENRDNNVSRILNLSDGLLGDAVKMKIICTFNTETKNIDPALMRKGRMKVKYEFKKLKKDKIEKLNDKLNLGLTTITEMTLAELFNHNDDNGCEIKKKRAVGFN